MRVLFIGYGFWPVRFGGAATIQWELLKSCQEIGLQPVIFQGGRYDFRNKLRLKRRFTNDGIELFELFNSPNRPGLRNPGSQVRNLPILSLSKEVVQKVNPDLVHIHELTFHCAKIIDLFLEMGIPCVKTIHNYWDICPQRDLLYNGDAICEDYLEGKRCVECRHSWVLSPLAAVGFDLLRNSRFLPAARIFLQGIRRVGRLLGSNGKVISSHTPEDIKELARGYMHRRREFIDHLNALTLLHVYSRRSGEILQQYGVRSDKIKYFPISTRTIDMIRLKPARAKEFPIVFGYRGGLAPHKGVHILVEAFEGLDQNKARLVIHGTGPSSYVRLLKKIGERTKMELRGAYQPEQIGQINAEIDVGIIPSIWEELFGLVGIEYNQSGIPVVASQVGGIKEYVRNGENGFLVRANDVNALRSAMKLFVESPKLIDRMREAVQKWICVNDMKENLRAFYMEAIKKGFAHV